MEVCYLDERWRSTARSNARSQCVSASFREREYCSFEQGAFGVYGDVSTRPRDDLPDIGIGPVHRLRGKRLVTFHDLDSVPSVAFDIKYWEGVANQQLQEKSRIQIFDYNFKVSPSEQYIAFTGCAKSRHEIGCGGCRWTRSRFAIGCCANGTLQWPPLSNSPYELEIRFDKYSRLQILGWVDQSSILLQTLDPSNGGLQFSRTFVLPEGPASLPTLYVHSMTKLRLVFLTSDDEIKISELDLDSGVLSLWIGFEPLQAVLVDTVCSTLVFVNRSGWLCSVDILDRDKHGGIKYHFWLPLEIVLRPKYDRNLLFACSHRGVVWIKYMHSKTWMFEVESLRLALKHVD
jgi:hypothetical protein